MSRRLRILTWHVHGNYLYYLSHVPHDFFLVTDAQRTTHHSGRSGTLPWGNNVHEAFVERIPEMEFDVVLYQSRAAWDVERLARCIGSTTPAPCWFMSRRSMP